MQMSMEKFLRTVFAGLTGYTPIAHFDTPDMKFRKDKGVTEAAWFHLPEQLEEMAAWAEARSDADLYFSPYVFSEKSRKAAFATATNVVHADIDTCPPERIRIAPSILWCTSPDKYQAVWITADGSIADKHALGKAMYHAHKAEGWDSGWGASKLLRLPGTTHNKTDTPYTVEVTELGPESYTAEQIGEHYSPMALSAASVASNAERDDPGGLHPVLAARVDEEPVEERRSTQRVSLIKFAVEWGLSDAEILYLLDEHRPTQQKYRGDRHIQYSLDDIADHRLLHDHIGQHCAEAHPQELDEWWNKHHERCERDRQKFNSYTANKRARLAAEQGEAKARNTEARHGIRAAKLDGGRIQLPDAKYPSEVADKLARLWRHRPSKLPRVRRWNSTWVAWTGIHYREMNEEEFNAALWSRLKNAYVITNDSGLLVQEDFNPTTAKLKEVTAGLKSEVMLPESTKPGTWITSAVENGTVVAVANGLVRLSDRELLEPTPAYFNLTSVPFGFDSQAECPNWESFLAQQWGDDPDSIALLQEWFGYVVSGKTKFQKALQLIGPKRSGKSTIMRILSQLVGEENRAAPTMQDLAKNFGMSMLTDKSLAVIDDARGRVGSEAVSRILSITGEGYIQVDRKNRDPWNGALPVRLVILSNEIPNFEDAAGTIVSRLVTLKTHRSFYGNEDPDLPDRLGDELPGILNWALEGLDRLLERGCFTEPASVDYLVEAQEERTSPVSDFVESCLEVATTPEQHASGEFVVFKSEVFNAWNTYCMQTNRTNHETPQSFSQKMYAYDAPGAEISRTQRRIEGPDGKKTRVHMYTGVKLSAQPVNVPNDLSGLAVQ